MTAVNTSLTPPEGARPPVRHPDAPAPGEPIGSDYDQCFGCGRAQPHGLRLDRVAAEGVGLTARFTVRPEHQGAPGLAHGGVLSAALDEVLGSVGWLMHVIAVTGRLETDFLLPVPVGTELHLHARATAVHGRKIYSTATGHLDGPDGPVAVRARALFVEVKVEHFVAHGREDELRAVMDDPERFAEGRVFEAGP